MPAKGWKILTVREELHKKLLGKSKAAGLSINDFIESRLTSQKEPSKLTSQIKKKSPRHGVSRRRGVGEKLEKRMLETMIQGLTPEQRKEQDDLEKAVEQVEARKKAKS